MNTVWQLILQVIGSYLWARLGEDIRLCPDGFNEAWVMHDDSYKTIPTV